MARSTVFIVNRSQAIRSPKGVAFPDGVHEVDIIKIGQNRLVCAAGKCWDDLFANGCAIPASEFRVENWVDGGGSST
jgi:antitoxin VapB